MSLRAKLSVSLLLMSFVTLLVTGFTARSLVLQRFDDTVVDRAFDGFIPEAVAYHQTYGSWAAADAAEPFHGFRTRLLREGDDIQPLRGDRASAPRAPRPPRPGADRPRPRRPGGPPPEGHRPPPPGAPPFVVTDAEGIALASIGPYRIGDALPAERMARARPIIAGDVELGWAVPLERPTLSGLEREYLAAMQEAMIISLLLAGLLAVPMGLILSSQLAKPIQRVTEAMTAMREGRLRQRVEVVADDEVGALAVSFNEMSHRLSDAYAELEASRAQLDVRAEEMAELSRTDPLTGLLNRRGFDGPVEALQAESMRYGQPLCIAVLDLDHFKQVNDDFSHVVGDRVLERAADLLRRELRDSDLVARFGGEEFVIAFPQTSLAGAHGLSDRLRSAFERTAWNDLVPGRPITVSVGVAAVTPGEGVESALARADDRLYEAKGAGRNRVEAGQSLGQPVSSSPSS